MSINAKLKISNSSDLSNIMKKRISGAFPKGNLEVGFFETSKYENGAFVASVAFWNDRGTANIPPRPFFRNAVSDNSKKWIDILGKEVKSGSDSDLALNRVGEIARGDIVESIYKTNTPSNSQSTINIKGSSKPLVDTGFMRANVTFRVVK